MFDILIKFKLLENVTYEAHPRIMAWNTLIGLFTHFVRETWPDTPLEPKLENVIKTLRLESDSEGDERREKQKWENYVAPGDKRPLDEFYEVNMLDT